MAGTVYLRTNKFEVKLEGITFKAKAFESLCKTDILFPETKIRFNQKPLVGIDVMPHPRDPSIVLVLLCFGVGCVILRFNSGEPLPEPIFKFLSDKRIQFVGFGIPEKRDLFPFEDLGLTKSNADIGYLAAKIFDDPKYKTSELSDLARKVLGVSKMVGLTAASSFERHEQIKCAICQLFLSTVIAMTLLRTEYKKKVMGDPAISPKCHDSPKKKNATTAASPKKKKLVNAAKMISCLKGMDTLSRLNEEWFNFPEGKKKQKSSEVVQKWFEEPTFPDLFLDSKQEEGENRSKRIVENWNDKPSLFGDFDIGFPEAVEKKENIKGVEKKEENVSQQAQVEQPPFHDHTPKDVFFGEEPSPVHCFFLDEPIHVESKNENVAQVTGRPSVETPFKQDGSLDEPIPSESKNETVAQVKGRPSVEVLSKQGSSDDELVQDKSKEHSPKKPLRGILKCPSTGLENYNLPPSPTVNAGNSEGSGSARLRRANSKGYNVSFKH